MGFAHNLADIRWDGPGGTLQIVEMRFQETVSQLAHLKLTVRSEDPAIKFKDMINAEAVVFLMAGEEMDQKRPFSGIITHFSQCRTGFGNQDKASTPTYYYDIEIRPKLWLLTKAKRSKVYQELNVEKIVTQVLNDHGVTFKWDLSPAPKNHEYCVQYQETDYQFIKRLCEHDGVFFYYDHKEKKVVFANHPGVHKPCREGDKVKYVEDLSPMVFRGPHELIQSLCYGEKIGSGKFVENEYNYRKSKTSLLNEDKEKKKPQFDSLEVYNHQTGFREPKESSDMAKLRKETETGHLKWIEGDGFCRGFAAGFTFNIEGHFNKTINKTKWMLLEVDIVVEQGKYRCHFKAMPADVPYHPPIETPVPRIYGVQTAVVTGPSGAEVYLDDLGRCKLQFHWDREGGCNDRSSMWCRVSNGYAGKDYGIQWIPRVGHEVLVSFIDGHPHRPLVTGRVYNDFNTPPLGPAKKYQNIIKTIKDNHIMFDDDDGKEMVDFRAQKNMNTLVLNDKTTTVGNDSSETVKKNKSVCVEEEDYCETVQKGHYSRTVKKNNKLTVQEGDLLISVETGCKKEVIKNGRSVTVNTGNSVHNVESGNYSLDVSTNCGVKVGANSSHNVTGSYSLSAASLGMKADKGGFSLDGKTTGLVKANANLTLDCPGGITIKCGGNTINLSAA